MTRVRLIKRTVIVASLALIPLGPVLYAQPSDQLSAGGIPEMMTGQPSPQHDVLTPEVSPVQTIWVNEIRNSLDMYKKNYPTGDFDPYFRKLNVVAEAVDRGERRVVKVAKGSFFKMPADRAHGINEDAAGELSNFAELVTPIREYGIPVPRSGSDQYGPDMVTSGSSQ